MLRVTSAVPKRFSLTFAATTLLLGSGYAALTNTPPPLYVLLPPTNRELARIPQGPETPFPTQLSSRLPYDVDINQARKLTRARKVVAAHRLFDIASWQAFIALNWPALADGSPDPTKNLSARYNNTPRVWAHWSNPTQVFTPRGAKPDPFPTADSWNRVKSHTLYIPRFKAALHHFKPGSVVVPEDLQAFSGPLVDQNGKWVHYQVMINREEYDYFVANTLYNLEGQALFAGSGKHVDFPMNQGEHKHGAIEIKLSWKQLGKGDHAERFFHTPAKILNTDTGKYETVQVGLVGMHIAMRTQSSPQWIWSTFEQVDNSPDQVGEKVKVTKPAYSFYNPKKSEQANVMAKQNAFIDPRTNLPVAPTPSQTPNGWFESKTTKPVQVTRVVAAPKPPQHPEVKHKPVTLDGDIYHEMHDLDNVIYASTARLNPQVQKLLKEQNSVFQYYKLIGSQWPVDSDAPGVPGGQGSAPQSLTRKAPGRIVPVFLVNSTMETYFQKGIQYPGPMEEGGIPGIVTDRTYIFGTESCAGCHYSAGICIGFKNGKPGRSNAIFGQDSNGGQNGNGDFSYLMQMEAQSTKD